MKERQADRQGQTDGEKERERQGGKERLTENDRGNGERNTGRKIEMRWKERDGKRD